MNNEKILKTYKEEGSMRKTAERLNISNTKVRKTLISLGEYETPLISQVVQMRKTGMSYTEIANSLGISKSAVYAYTPYEKGMYDSDTPTKNALNIRKYKKKKKEAERK